MAGRIALVNHIRAFCADVVQKANSGHPGAPMGMAPMAHVLWTKFLNFTSEQPYWANRDRFVLSNGHACALLYTMLHLCEYPAFPLEQLKNFRQLHSNTPGHPECFFGGIEVSTGPLGQGISNAVGFAIGEAHLAAVYNKPDFELFNNYVYVFCGDGCMMEGISSEAASLAGHLGLGKLIVLYDDNKITIDGSTDLAFSEDVGKRFEAYGWQVLIVEDGDSDLDAIEKAINEGRAESNKPTLIKVRTTIGYGSAKQATDKVHGTPLGDEDIKNVKKKFGLDPEKKFHIPDELYQIYKERTKQGSEKYKSWVNLLENYSQKYPKEGQELKDRLENKFPDNWQDLLPKYKPEDKPVATRVLSQYCLSSLYDKVPALFGGSADLAPSNMTIFNKEIRDFQRDNRTGRNMRFGVREHAMAAICNGLSAYGGFIPYGATFLNFIGYCLGSVTLSALSGHGVIYIFTHDSIGLGEDGPTHQPVEKLMLCRATPNLLTLRPADGNEVTGAYIVALEHRKNPSVFSLSRQNLPQLKGSSVEGVRRGAYVLQDSEGTPEIIFAGTGSEVSICVKAAELLSGIKVRVVSMPCWELFDQQPQDYKNEVFPKGAGVVSIEAGVTFGWEKYAHASVGLHTFGASAPYEELYKHFGITAENAVAKAHAVLTKYGSGQAPHLVHRL